VATGIQEHSDKGSGGRPSYGWWWKADQEEDDQEVDVCKDTSSTRAACEAEEDPASRTRAAREAEEDAASRTRAACKDTSSTRAAREAEEDPASRGLFVRFILSMADRGTPKEAAEEDPTT